MLRQSILPTLITAILFCCMACSSDSNHNSNNNNTPTDSSQQTTTVPAIIAPTGTYEANMGAGGTGKLVVQEKGSDSIQFQLTVVMGGPSSPSGTATGTIALKDNKAVIEIKEYDAQNPCFLKFKFEADAAMVLQESNSSFACGFGNGVIADGHYQKVSTTATFDYEGGTEGDL